MKNSTIKTSVFGLLLGGLIGLSLPSSTIRQVANILPPPAAPKAEQAKNAPAAEIPESFMARAREYIEKREYWASPSDKGLQAPNRAQKLRSYFSDEGITVMDREDEGSPELLKLNYAGVYRGDKQVLAVKPGEVSHEENRVEIDRGEVLEWYVNSKQGLEQGFDIARRPAGEGELRVLLDMPGVTLRQSRTGLKIRTGAGRVLNYGKLKVLDATQSTVPSYFRLVGKQSVALVVDDNNAQYPLSIDPLLTASYDAFLEGDYKGARIGHILDSAGDVNGDGYNDVIIGVSQYSDGVSSGSAVIVFHGGPGGIGDGSIFNADTLLFFPGGFNLSMIQGRVTSAGDVNGDGYDDVIVGIPSYENGEYQEGAVFVFHGSSAGIPNGGPATANTVIESNIRSIFFGSHVASAGDVNGDTYDDVIIGADRYKNGQVEEGGAYIYHGSATGIVSGSLAEADTILESDQAYSRLGMNVASAGDVNGDGFDDVIVDALEYTLNGTIQRPVFVFHGGPTGVLSGTPNSAAAVFDPKQKATGFGNFLSSAGDVNGDGYGDVVVGAGGYDNGTKNEGAVFVFHGGSGGIGDRDPATADAILESNQEFANMGYVGSAGDINGDGFDDLTIGVWPWDGSATNSGATFIFYGSSLGVGDGSPRNADVTLDAGIAGTYFSYAVASAGDINGDGYNDVIVGAPQYQNGELVEGAVYVFHGNAERVAGINFSPITGRLTTTELGDVDSFTVTLDSQPSSDVTVPLTSSDPGECVVPPSVTVPAAAWATGVVVQVVGVDDVLDDGDQPCAIQTGISVSGDVDYAGINPHDVYVTNRDDDSIASEVSAFLQGDQGGAKLGYSVASAGDVNGDGFDDIIVGAPWFDRVIGSKGAAFIFYGSTVGTGDDSPPDIYSPFDSVSIITGDQWGGQMGRSVASAGDVNRDGYDDVIVSSPGYDNGNLFYGAVFVFHGSPSGIQNSDPSKASAKIIPYRKAESFGIDVASAGDVNGDGYDDVILSAPGYDVPWTDVGAVYIYHGGPGGIGNKTTQDADTFLSSDFFSWGRLGLSVASAGDVNGDGYDDVIIRPNSKQTNLIALIYHGSANGIPDGDYDSADARISTKGKPILLGTFAGSAGDVNNDGYDDVIVGGNYYYTWLEPHEGMAVVFHGGPSGIVSEAEHAIADGKITFDQTETQTAAGASAGDFNGDGYDDVIVGAHRYDNGETDEGAAFVFFGGPSGVGVRTSASADAIFDSDQTNSLFGWEVASAGDVNGDGKSDVIVGAYGYSNGETEEGAAFIFHGGGSGAGGPGPQPGAEVIVDPISGLTTTEAGGTAEFTVSLSTQPSADVTIPLSTSNLAECSVPASVTVAVADWSTGVPVTVTGVDDAVDDGDQPCTVITGPAVSGDPDYDGLDPADVDATNLDDEIGTADLQLLLSDSLDPGLPATPFSYTATVYNLGPDDSADALLTVTVPADYTVSAAAGTGWSCSILASVVSCTNSLLLSGASSAVTLDVSSAVGGSFTLDATVISTAGDPDTANNSASETTTINSAPEFTSTQGDVVVKVGELFSYTAQGTDADGDAVIISVVDAPPWLISTANPDGSLTLEGTVPAGQSGSVWPVVLDISDGTLNGTPQSFTITPAGINVSPVSGLVIGEDGTSDTFVVTLDSQPTADVVLPFGSSDIGECSAPASITIPAAAWSTGVTITVTGVDDPLDDGDQACTILTGVSTSADANYAGIDPADVDVTNIDDDTAEADLSVTLADSADPVLPGTTFTYTATVSNAGTWDALDAVMNITLPGDYSVIAASGAGWTCAVAGNVVSCANPLLAIGAVSPVSIEVSSLLANSFSVDAEIASATLDPVNTNNKVTEFTLVNTPPVALPPPLPVAVVEDTPSAITLAGTDADGQVLTYEIVTNPINGVLSGTDANRTYTPNLNYFGADSFTFRVFDGFEYSAEATVDISVSPVNDAPYFTSAQSNVILQVNQTFTYTAQGADPESDPFVISLAAGPNWLTATANPDGTLDLAGAPAQGQAGTTSIVTLDISDGLLAGAQQTFTITVNGTPRAFQDRVTVVQGSGPVEIDVLANDTDPEGDVLSILAVKPPSDGVSTATIIDTPLGQRIRFELDPAATGGGSAITFSYTASDGNGGVDTGTVRVRVSKK